MVIMKFLSKSQLIVKPALAVLLTISTIISCSTSNSNMADKKICIDPGHGGTAAIDSFRVGPTGEREEWINLRVALELKSLLERSGCDVILTRTTDVSVQLKDRALIAIENEVDVFISIHHNATADTTVNFPIVYFHGNASENQAGVQLGISVIKNLSKILFNNAPQMSLVSDHTIFPTSGTAVLRLSYGIPGVIGEASFFTHPIEEKRLKIKEYNTLEARAYFIALEEFFSSKTLPIRKKSSEITITPFEVLQETRRMNPVALRWRHDYSQGVSLLNFQKEDSLQKSFDLLSRSIRSFPDSWLAGSAHAYRAQILEMQQKFDQAKIEKHRIAEYYINLN